MTNDVITPARTIGKKMSQNIDHRRQEVQQIVKNACDQLNAEGVDARNYVEPGTRSIASSNL
jgi:hypothetical protein